MASVRKRKWVVSGQPKEAWVVEYTDQSGKRRRVTPKSGLKRDAEKERLRVEKEIEVGHHIPSSEAVSFGEVYTLWLQDCKRRWEIKDGMTGNGYHAYERNGRLHVLPALQDVPMNKLTHIHVQDMINAKSGALGRKALQYLMIVVRGVIRFAFDKSMILADPLAMRKIRIPAGEQREMNIPTKDEIRILFESLAQRRTKEHHNTWKNRISFVTLSLFAGLRKGEICGLQWESVDFNLGVIHVRHSLSFYDGLKGPKTKAGIRRVPMAGPVRKVLEWVASEAPKPLSGFVLHNGRDGSPVLVGSLSTTTWNPMMKAAGLALPDGRPKYSIHIMRHAAASMLIQQGLDAFVLKGIMGHSKVSMTYDIYGHLFADDDRGAAAVHAAADRILVTDHIPSLAGTRQ